MEENIINIENRLVKPWPCGCWCLENSTLEVNIWARTNGLLSTVNDLNLNQAPYSRGNLKRYCSVCMYNNGDMHDCSTERSGDRRGCVVVGFTATYAISKVVSLNPTRRSNSIQHNVIKCQ